MTRGLRARLSNDLAKVPGASEFKLTEDVGRRYIKLEITGGGARVSRKYPVTECGYKSLLGLRSGISEFLKGERKLTCVYL